jgi:hypothetical protein
MHSRVHPRRAARSAERCGISSARACCFVAADVRDAAVFFTCPWEAE